MKTTLFLLVLTASISAASAQDAYDSNSDYQSDQPDTVAAPAVVYQAPVTYAGPVVYQGPVVYYAPVFYGMPMGYALNACAACQDTAVRSTVTYIGGGHTRFQISTACNDASTLVKIGHWWPGH